MQKDRPLGLPEGSVRAILAIGITAGSFLLFLFKKDFQVSSFLSLVGLPIGLYFGQYISPAGGRHGVWGGAGDRARQWRDLPVVLSPPDPSNRRPRPETRKEPRMADDEVPPGTPEQTDNRPRDEDGEQASIDQTAVPSPGS